jgi:hypothetical protein
VPDHVLSVFDHKNNKHRQRLLFGLHRSMGDRGSDLMPAFSTFFHATASFDQFDW